MSTAARIPKAMLFTFVVVTSCQAPEADDAPQPVDDVQQTATTGCSFTVTQNVYDGPGWWGTISFKNNGPSASSAFQVSFGIPSGAACDFAPTGWTYSQSGSTCTYKKPGATLAAGASTTFNYSTNSQNFSAASNVTVTDSTCTATCTPESNTSFCSRLGKNCGAVTGTDNCGVSRSVSSCGTCTSPATCGGGGTPNVCGTATCTPESNTSFCSRLGKNCGAVTGTDNCGASRSVSSCGTCTSPATCGGGGTPNVCGASSGSPGCSFTVTQNVYDAKGWWGTISFKNNGPSPSSAFAVSFGVPSGAHCDFAETGWTFSQSGTVCTYKKPGTTLAAGGSLTFHYSADSQAFSAASGVEVTDSTCGGSSCTPESNTTFCSRLSKNCGTVTGTDNCGVSRTVSSCGTCTSPATCGGGGTSNVCGTSSGGGGGGNFPSRFTAPYVATWNNTNLVNLSNGTGNKFWTLAFIINGSGSCNPTWNGDTSLTGNSYGTYITNLRSIGGDVIVSFGGASGTEIAKSCPDVATTQAAYQKVINQFKLTWIDLDIESGQESDTASVDRRNKAMKNLQAANPGLRISYTLAVDRSGLPSGPRNLLANAKSNGVAVTTVNIMAMDYGPCYTDMGQAAIDAANATRSQLSSLGLNAKVGVTPMIGTNDVTCEKFTTTDASVLVNYAKGNSFINLLAYWVQDADSSHSYINIFKMFP